MLFSVFEEDVERSLQIAVDARPTLLAREGLAATQRRMEPAATTARFRGVLLGAQKDATASALRDFHESVAEGVVAHPQHATNGLGCQPSVHS